MKEMKDMNTQIQAKNLLIDSKAFVQLESRSLLRSFK